MYRDYSATGTHRSGSIPNDKLGIMTDARWGIKRVANKNNYGVNTTFLGSKLALNLCMQSYSSYGDYVT